ncbi:MAG: hypothetical protein HFF83_07750, partial [Oscillibacter sp.]|nr:hypothetical protein [Oscillibacter sp.]
PAPFTNYIGEETAKLRAFSKFFQSGHSVTGCILSVTVFCNKKKRIPLYYLAESVFCLLFFKFSNRKEKSGTAFAIPLQKYDFTGISAKIAYVSRKKGKN